MSGVLLNYIAVSRVLLIEYLWWKQGIQSLYGVIIGIAALLLMGLVVYAERLTVIEGAQTLTKVFGIAGLLLFVFVMTQHDRILGL